MSLQFSKRAWMNIILVFYVASGILQPTLIEVLTYNGACEKSTMLFILPNYIGMSLGVLSNIGSLYRGKIRWGRMITLVLIDLCSGILCFTGLVSAGSAVFTVVYSSVTVYAALFSWFIFGRQLHIMQWTGVFLVMLGLIASSFGSSFGEEGDEEVGIGIIMIMIGSMFHSLSYIVSESIMKSEHPIAPEFLGSFLGVAGCIVFGGWQLVYTLPRFQTLIVDEIASHNGDLFTIILTYIILTVVNFIHGVCFFHTIKNVGSTTTGIFKGVQSVLVFIISHFAFCSIQHSQCFSLAKGLSLVVVVAGVIMYSSFRIEPMIERQGRKDLMSKASTIWFEGNRDGIEALAVRPQPHQQPHQHGANGSSSHSHHSHHSHAGQDSRHSHSHSSQSHSGHSGHSGRSGHGHSNSKQSGGGHFVPLEAPKETQAFAGGAAGGHNRSYNTDQSV